MSEIIISKIVSAVIGVVGVLLVSYGKGLSAGVGVMLVVGSWELWNHQP